MEFMVVGMAGTPHFSRDLTQQTDSRQEVGPGVKTTRPSHSDPLPQKKLQAPKALQSHKRCHHLETKCSNTGVTRRQLAFILLPSPPVVIFCSHLDFRQYRSATAV